MEWIREINGTKMESYIDWMGTCSAITVTGSPAISVPCGFTPGGLPVGLQIVGPYRRDFDVLQMAHAFEMAPRLVCYRLISRDQQGRRWALRPSREYTRWQGANMYLTA